MKNSMNKRQRKKAMHKGLERSYIMKYTASWGVGSYKHGNRMVYGYPTIGMNPHNYFPDTKDCLPEEIRRWEEAKQQWNVKKGIK